MRVGEKKVEDILEDLVRRVAAPQLRRQEGFLSLEEASDFLGGMPISSLMEKVRNGVIPAYKPGRHAIFDPKELREYVKRFKVAR